MYSNRHTESITYTNNMLVFTRLERHFPNEINKKEKKKNYSEI